MTSEEFIVKVKTQAGDQRARDGQLIRDMDDRELMKKMLERYPGERENIEDIDDYLGEEVKNLPEAPKPSSVVQELEEIKKSPSFLQRAKNFVKEAGSDVVETVKNVGSEIKEGAGDIYDIAGRSDINFAQKLAATSGEIASTVAQTVGEAVTGVGKLGLTQQSEDNLKKMAESLGEKVSETETMQKLSDWYSGLDKDDKIIVDSLGGIGSLVTEVVGLKGVSTLAKPIAKTTVEVADKTAETLKNVPAKIDEVLEPRRQARIEKTKAEIDDAAGRILQGKPEDIEQGKRALSNIDTTGVKTYEELNERIDDNVKTLSTKQDELLNTQTTPLKSTELANRIDVNGQTVFQNPVEDALTELGTYYTKINDAVGAEKIRQLSEKLNTDGLLLKEVNDIARLHGKDLNAFNASGELASGLSKQAAENTRKGLKTVVRDRLEGDVSKEIDKQISDLLKTSDLTKKMEDNVNKLYQKLKKRTLAAKVGGVAADVVDLASLGTLRGFIAKMFPSNVGLKTANSLDLERELEKNLKKIEELNKIKDPKKFSEKLEDLQNDLSPGLIIRSTVRPDLVAKRLDKEDFKKVTKLIDDPELRIEPNYSPMIKEMGLEKASDDELVSFLKEVVDEYDNVAERDLVPA